MKQTEYEWLYIFAAVNLATGESSALIAATVSTALMSAHLGMISRQVGPDRHVVLVLDQAGWHLSKDLCVPENITLLYLPPYSPELNPVERVWDYLRSHYLSNRVFKDEDQLWQASTEGWNRIDQATLRTICHTAWTERCD